MMITGLSKYYTSSTAKLIWGKTLLLCGVQTYHSIFAPAAHACAPPPLAVNSAYEFLFGAGAKKSGWSAAQIAHSADIFYGRIQPMIFFIFVRKQLDT
jgi:hypothetical protein